MTKKRKNVVTVADLIKHLNKVKDKTLPVFVYTDNEPLEVSTVLPVDDSMSDRVDINVNEEEE